MPKPTQRESGFSVDSSSLLKGGLDLRLTKKQRMVSSRLFQETFAQKKRWVGKYMVFWRRSGEGASLRLGVVTSKKISLRANKRNRVRRCLREAYRQIRPYLFGDYDVLLIGRRNILQAKWSDIVLEMLLLAKRAKMIDSDKIEIAKRDLNLHL